MIRTGDQISKAIIVGKARSSIEYVILIVIFVAAMLLILHLFPNSLHWERTTNNEGIITSKWFDLRPVIAMAVTVVVGGIVAQLRGRLHWKQYFSGLAIFAGGTAVFWLLFFRDLTH